MLLRPRFGTLARMRYRLTEHDAAGREKRHSFHATVEEAMKEAENGYGSYLSQHWQRDAPGSDCWTVREPVNGGSWRIEPVP